MFIKCGLHQDSGAAAYAQLPRCPVAAAVVSEGITATESWNHPLAPERLSAAERLVVPSERAQLDPPEIKKEKKKKENQWFLSTDLLFCSPQSFNWTWQAAPGNRQHLSVAPSLLTHYHFYIY